MNPYQFDLERRLRRAMDDQRVRKASLEQDWEAELAEIQHCQQVWPWVARLVVAVVLGTLVAWYLAGGA
ncbi:MAG TPA: hypothetical protein VM537_16090 [Anaerolineae bacterium]|nr:hypothetical protein [Anaerolineae bacterium]HUX02446.1 hypothetical protein [Phycisphaerae bacterium]